MGSKLRWGILGAGNIAKAFAKGLAGSQTGQLVAVGSRSQEKADKFGAEFGVKRCHGSYEALLADKDVQAVYIATPHPMHAEWAIKAAEAGKHILCEKPIGINHAEAMIMVEAAQRNDVFLMEAFMYRCHPQTAKLVELLKARTIGEVRMIRATFGFNAGYDPESRLFKNALGGGGILDVGCYATSMSRLVAGVAMGKDFADPVEVKGCGHLVPETGVDGWTAATLKFPGEIVAQVATSIQLSLDSEVLIFGSEGTIRVPDPWIPARDGGTVKIFVSKGGKTEEIAVETKVPLYGIEADTVAAHVAKRQAPSPAMSWCDTLGNMKTLDAWREAAGVVYETEKFEACAAWHQTRPIAVRKDNRMKYGKIAGVAKQVSRLVMGVDNITAMPHIFAVFDDFYERGGNTFDTAYIYGDGRCETAIGQWVKKRGVREEVVILDKGAHTPYCTPEHLTSQLKESLERLQSDYMDIYMMHRDNLAVPVGEFVEVLNEHLRASRMRAFGGSNWTLERVEAFNAYAKKKGLKGFAAVSNNFSLARMVEPPWDGCMASSTPEFKAWHTRAQMPLMPWSSQAHGFFTRASKEDRSEAELVRCWYADDNFQRLERARQTAKKRGVLPIQIALAYVLGQPFPTFPLIGPRSLAETRTSFGALDIDLGPEDRAWLNLER